jgi:drug/metabolite transporter (DMT)-like permease
MSAPKMTAREWGLLILLSFFWGGAFFLAAVALKEVTHHGLAFFRVLIAALALGLLSALLQLSLPRDWGVWRRIAVLALFSTAIPFTLLYWAQTQIPSGLAAVLNAMTPIFTLLLAHVFTRDEKIDTQRFVGVLAGVCGVIIIVGPTALGGHDGDILAEIAVLGAALCYGIASIFSRRVTGLSPITLSFAQMVVASVYLLPVMLLTGAPLRFGSISLTTVGAVIGIGVLSTALAFVLFFHIAARAGATNAVLVTLMVPVSAILLGVFVLGESLGARQVAGLVLIALGLLINDGRPFAAMRGWITHSRQRPDVSGSAAPHMLNEPHHSR